MCVFDPIELQSAGFEITGGIDKGCHNLRAVYCEHRYWVIRIGRELIRFVLDVARLHHHWSNTPRRLQGAGQTNVVCGFAQGFSLCAPFEHVLLIESPVKNRENTGLS